MMILMLIGGLCGILALLLSENKVFSWDIFVAGVGGIFLIAGVFTLGNDNAPQAIDVYRGNTTLKITYQDSVAVDTIVVFKNK